MGRGSVKGDKCADEELPLGDESQQEAGPHRATPRPEAGALDATRPRRRGRPRQSPDPELPPEQWLDGLSPTAIHIAEVARRLLIDEGFEAVTIENVALAANVDPTTVRRQFISKAGLVWAVWDRLEIEPWAKLVEHVRGLHSTDERLRTYIGGLGELIADPRTALGISEVLSHGLRDPVVQEKLALDYQIARDGTLQLIGLEPADDRERQRLETLVSLIVSVIDGLALQVAAAPAAVDRDAVFTLLADMVATYLDTDKPIG